MTRPSYKRLEEALEHAAVARACIAQNRGPDKELARESYEHAVAEELLPALLEALEDAAGDFENPRAIERFAEKLLVQVKKEGLSGS